MKFSVVIPAFNEETHIASAVRAVQSQVLKDGDSLEVIVVDNNSSDGFYVTVGGTSTAFPGGDTGTAAELVVVVHDILVRGRPFRRQGEGKVAETDVAKSPAGWHRQGLWP